MKDPKVGDGPTRLIGTFDTREEAEKAGQKQATLEENLAYNFLVEADETSAE